jgi:CheY-like chemotaxis protein
VSDSVPAVSERARHIVVADEDPTAVAFIVRTLRGDGHAVFHAYDVLAATQLAFTLDACDLVITDTKVEGTDGVELIALLRQRRPNVPVIYLANTGRSTPELEARLPADVPILREPFTADVIRSTVDSMLDGKGDGGRS